LRGREGHGCYWGGGWSGWVLCRSEGSDDQVLQLRVEALSVVACSSYIRCLAGEANNRGTMERRRITDHLHHGACSWRV
jgi:hypothetical protein